MPWDLPTPEAIAARMAAQLEAQIPGLDARSPNRMAAILTRAQALAASDLWLYQQYLSGEMFADSATELARHGAIWGVARNLATPAGGTVRLLGVTGTVVPAGIVLSAANGLTYTTQAGITLAGSVADTVAVLCSVAGSQGNLLAGVALTLATPFAGLSGATVSAGGIAGQDDEALESWRARILRRIRVGPDYGQTGSYARAALSVPGVGYAVERPLWLGAGSVGVVVAMAGPAVPSGGQLAQVQAALDAMRPVTANVLAVAASLSPVAVTLSLNPDTVVTRAAVQSALAAFFLSEGAIGGTLYRSRLVEAISSASGEYSHSLTAPSGDVALGATSLATLGTVTFV